MDTSQIAATGRNRSVKRGSPHGYLLLVPVSSYRYKPRQNDNRLRERLIALAREKPRFGYRRLHVLLGREGEQVNHKRVHRIYCEAGLALRRKKRKHCVRLSTPLGIYTAANQEWALDFVHDAVASGRSIRVLNVIDTFTRESLAMEVDTSFAGLPLRGCSTRSSPSVVCRGPYAVTTY